MQNRLFSLLFLAFITVLSPTVTMAQRYYNSPLSRFNLGTLENTASVRSMGMGGTGLAIRVRDQIYESNPASYSAIDTNSLVFDFGVDLGILSISNGVDKYSSDDMSFHHIKLAFPIRKNIGMAFGIVPYTNSYYHLSSIDKDNSKVNHTGEGGLTNVFAGVGAKIYKGLSAGINMNILYGEISRYNFYEFDDQNVNNLKNSEYIYFRGTFLDFGAQYEQTFSNNRFAIVGINTTFGNDLKSQYKDTHMTYNSIYSCIIYSVSDSTKATLPTKLNFGLSFGVKEKLTISADYTSSLWKNSDIKATKDYISNSNSIKVGAEYVPNVLSYYNLLERIEYRIGGHLDNYYVSINDSQLKGYGVSIGLGIPMRKSYSKVNFYADYSRKSLPGPSKYLEDFITFGFSLNLYERWFIQTKFN